MNMKKIDLNKSLEDYCEEARLYVESLTLINSIYNLFTENRDIALSSNEVFAIIVAPFYSKDTAFLPLVKTICDYWVIEGKINRIEIDSELFYHAI